MIRHLKSIVYILLLFTCFFGIINHSLAVNDTIYTEETTVKEKASISVGVQTESTLNKLDPPSLSNIISWPKILWTIILIIIGYILIRIIMSLLSAYGIRNPKHNLLIKRILPIFRIITWAFLIYIIIVGVFNPPAAALLAFFASIGIAVGFAAQDLVKNLFGGLVVMFDRPFQIGDKIEAGGQYGEVIEIGIRSTKIVTPDDSVITIPNSEFMSQFVSNSNSGENNCQVVAEIYLPLDIDTEKVRKIATEAAQISKYIYLNKPIVVLFFNEMQMNRSVIKMRLKAYVSDLSKEFAFKSEMTEIVIKTLIEEKILIPDEIKYN